ncbi:hypothetical protein [Croceicoccus sp. YJ47]|uniref:hypothetical protein n=1 Tax=Croceicoccus sp. YJ47 TaxID=2798724 RepID=UPI00192347D6|nr:hypothetical protein [Croceicoccus sp. YJ47]QQN74732.1 hypothetical protein JD971_03075 [Croceicoccus sp. YJ47]
MAFRGDPAVKAELLARLREHAANGTLRFGATQWDGQGGSPLGISVQGGDSVDYAERYGYPLALGGLLDPMTAYAAPDTAEGYALRWVSSVEPGADLSAVPQRIARTMLRAMGADRLASPYYGDLLSLYEAEGHDAPPPRRAWSELRRAIEQAAAEAPPHGERQFALKACANACWPLRTSRSALTALIADWVQHAAKEHDPEFDAVEHEQAIAMLDRIYAETQPERDKGEHVDIPAIFRSRAPALAAAFELHLNRANARYIERARTVPDIVLDTLATHAS